MLAAAALLLALSVTCAPAAAQTELLACASKPVIVRSDFHVHQAVLEDLELHFPEAAHLGFELGAFIMFASFPQGRRSTRHFGQVLKGSLLWQLCILALMNHRFKANCGRDLQSLWLMIFANQENMCPLSWAAVVVFVMYINATRRGRTLPVVLC